ncbi:NAD(P)-binding domain-containing protein [uncultured Umboniibacter sp.]|uniref:flavin-containing monooxygenase n=1 Tax=uncultured Umboniibacter sp. TaxID=1798917 RepID=UPI00262AFBD4|nr:NAD(P)-binding domain-containing protein [uncultured Umboniibacter sp.]
MKEIKKVAIIGTGPSGITAIKNFSDQGFAVTAFDRCEGVGGNWRFNDPSGHSSVFETTHLISSKYTSFYEDFPLPDSTPDYPSHTELLSYFNAYTDHFDIRKLIRFNTEVTNCRKLDGDRWEVEWKTLGSNVTNLDEYDALVICNGHHHKPRYPDYPGEFTGELLHSHEFKSAKPFQDKRVLVIGGGNSACDVAVETARVSKSTSISWRRGYYLIPKFMYGLPTDVQAIKNRWMPDFLRGPFTRVMLEIFQGKNEDIGLQKPDKSLNATHPTVNSELYYAVRHGKVKPHVDIERYEGSKVVFKDGTSEEFDVIIACTGFKIKHDFFDKSLINYEEGQVPLLHKMIPADINNLYFIGLFQPLGCIWPGAELQSKLAAQHLLGNWKPKKSIKALIERELANPDVKQIDTPRHTITVDDISFRARLKKEIKRSISA